VRDALGDARRDQSLLKIIATDEFATGRPSVCAEGHPTMPIRTTVALCCTLALSACASDPDASDDDSSSSGAADTSTGEQADTVYAAVVRGTLAGDDLAASQQGHDAFAMMGEASAAAAGDIAHDVLLGTTLLDSTENEFLAIDRWTDRDAMLAFYADPNVAAGFGSLFAAAPTIEYFELAADWESWGDMSSGDSYDPYYFHFALGELAQADEQANHTAHDQVAAGGKDPSLMAGNVAHIVFLGLDDRRRFLGLDIWKSDDNMEAFYTNPMFVQVFAPLFTSVTQPVFVSTEWYQW
jgi:quinol monooxygenase YgiN